MPPLLADFIHARGCKPICEKSLTLPDRTSPPRAACGQLQAADLILDEGAHGVRELVQ